MNKRIHAGSTTLLFIALLLTGCGSLLKSDYQRPMLSVPDEWRVKDSGAGYLHHSTHWWENFDDPQLSDSINRMLVSNNDLATAGLTLQKARLTALRDPHKSALINQHHISVGFGEVIKNGAQHRSL